MDPIVWLWDAKCGAALAFFIAITSTHCSGHVYDRVTPAISRGNDPNIFSVSFKPFVQHTLVTCWESSPHEMTTTLAVISA